jgi:ATP-dependent Clp protease adaptor protein ClpS
VAEFMNKDIFMASPGIKWQEELEVDVLESQNHSIILWNDEVNTFDWVIESLIEVCNHTPEQAEQCAMFVHFKGKYAVKNGDFEELRPQCEALLDRGINATID